MMHVATTSTPTRNWVTRSSMIDSVSVVLPQRHRRGSYLEFRLELPVAFPSIAHPLRRGQTAALVGRSDRSNLGRCAIKDDL